MGYRGAMVLVWMLENLTGSVLSFRLVELRDRSQVHRLWSRLADFRPSLDFPP